MLSLTRRIGEIPRVGDQVTVTVIGVKGDRVSLAIKAPKDILVLREELAEREKGRLGKSP